MAIIFLTQLSDGFYSLQKYSEITQKKIELFYYDKTMVNFWKGCDVYIYLYAVAHLSQKGGKYFYVTFISLSRHL